MFLCHFYQLVCHEKINLLKLNDHIMTIAWLDSWLLWITLLQEKVLRPHFFMLCSFSFVIHGVWLDGRTYEYNSTYFNISPWTLFHRIYYIIMICILKAIQHVKFLVIWLLPVYEKHSFIFLEILSYKSQKVVSICIVMYV